MALLFGVHTDTDPAATVAKVGGNATRVFTSGVIAPRDLVREVGAKCAPSWAAGQIPCWSFKPAPAAVADGSWRPYVEDLGAFLHDNPAKPVNVIIWHEPENDIPHWFASPEDFVRLFDTVAGWLRGKHPGAVVVHAALAYRYGDNRDVTDAVAPRWRTSADIHCADVYSGRSNPLDTILPELSSYRRWRKYVARDSAWGITERGWTLGAGGSAATRVATMAREATWLAGLPAGQQPQIYLMWNTPGTEGDQGLVFDNGAEQVARSITTAYAARSAAQVAARAAAAAGATGAATTATGAGGPASPASQQREVTCPLCAGSGKYRFTV